ncbi:hypothetical protein WN943_010996 [Citrus x changshan-huyou]
MASTPAPKTIKKLGQFLEEQQEPFILEIYLSERGCIKKQKKNLNSSKFLKRSTSLNNSIKGVTIYSKLLKAAYNKLVPIKDSPKVKNSNDGQEVAEANQFSSASSTTTEVNSCSESEVKLQKDDISFRGHNCRSAENEAASVLQEESEQISPVSVLQEENQSRSTITQAKNITEDSLLSASLWNLEELVCSKLNSKVVKSKKILQQTKQLLFDCVREVLKTNDENGNDRRQQSCREFMGPELLGKLMSEKLKAWEKQSGDELNITRLLDFDFQDSVQEWSDFKQQMRDIAFKIGDAILEEIRDQLVTDLVSM